MTRRIPDTVLRAFVTAHWAMTPDAMRRAYQVITRQGSPEAVARESGARLDNTNNVSVRDGIAYIPLVGPMIRYGDSFEAICGGATSYERIATDLEAAARDSRVRAIVLNGDSPGGEVSGMFDLAEQVREADERKPVYGLASGMSASACYVVLAATRRIYANPSAVVGSLGVCMSIEDASEMDRKLGIRQITIVSSQTPRKNQDITTEAGYADAQRVVDELGGVLLETVARYRGVPLEAIAERYGAGAVMAGPQALGAGLVDEIAYTEALHAQLLTMDHTARAPRLLAAAAPRSTPPKETPMKFAVKSKVKTTAAIEGVAALGDEGVVEETRDDKYRVAFAGGTSAWLAESALKAAPAAADGGATGEEEDDEDNEDDDAPAAATDGAEDGDDEDDEDEDPPAPTAAADPVRAERERVLGIQALAMPGEEELVQACVNDPSCTVAAAALRLRQAQARQPADRLAARRASDAGKPRAGVRVPAVNGSVSPKAARVIAAIGRVFPQRKPDAPAKS